MTARRYPLQDLFDLMGRGHREAGDALAMSGRTRALLMRHGLTERQADRYAVRAGFHPFIVWPQLMDDVIADVLERDRQAREKARERSRRWTAKRRATRSPEERAREMEYQAAYRASRREQARDYRRAYYRKNRERELARQAEYDRTVRRAKKNGIWTDPKTGLTYESERVARPAAQTARDEVAA